MIVNWQIIGGVEVQVFKPETPSRSAMLFCPGFPGLGGALFEQRHAATLTDQGYNLYVIHHKGTRTQGAIAPSSINNGLRLQEAWQRGETHLGGGPASFHDLLNEPEQVFALIEPMYDQIDIVGNSFGALSSLKMLTDGRVSADKVKSLVLLAGAQGINDGSDECVAHRVWKPEFIGHARIADQIEVLDVPGAVTALRDFYSELPGRVRERLPAHIKLTYVVVENDEILRLQDTLDFQKAIGGRGEIVMEYDEGFPDYGITPHYTANYKTSNLLELIK